MSLTMPQAPAYAGSIVAHSTIRIDSRETRRIKRASQSSAFFHARKFMVGCVGKPSGLPVPCSGLSTQRTPPPFCRLTAARWRLSTLTRSLP